jgi:hypothetical protein
MRFLIKNIHFYLLVFIIVINTSVIICEAADSKIKKEKRELIDPFEPFDIKSSLDKNKDKKSGIERLKLTAIIQMKKRSIALAEDESGKGYILEKGTKFDNDKIDSILNDRIIIEKKIKNFSGKTVVKKQEIILSKE